MNSPPKGHVRVSALLLYLGGRLGHGQFTCEGQGDFVPGFCGVFPNLKFHTPRGRWSSQVGSLDWSLLLSSLSRRGSCHFAIASFAIDIRAARVDRTHQFLFRALIILISFVIVAMYICTVSGYI